VHIESAGSSFAANMPLAATLWISVRRAENWLSKWMEANTSSRLNMIQKGQHIFNRRAFVCCAFGTMRSWVT